MTVETTLPHGLKTSVIDTDYEVEDKENLALLDKNRIQVGLLADRPAAGTAERFYYATDTGELTYDDGTSWIAAVDAIAYTDNIQSRRSFLRVARKTLKDLTTTGWEYLEFLSTPDIETFSETGGWNLVEDPPVPTDTFYTIPRDGLYEIYARTALRSNVVAKGYVGIAIDSTLETDSPYLATMVNIDANDSPDEITISDLVELTAGQTVSIKVKVDAGTSGSEVYADGFYQTTLMIKEIG